MNKIKQLVLLIFCAVIIIPISCGKNLAILSESNESKIYGTVIKQLYVVDYPPGSVTGYIMRYTDDSAGTESPMLNYALISESLQKAVLTALGDIQLYFKWVDKGSNVSEQVLSGSCCQIILGNIHLQEDDSVQVTASLFYGGTSGGGTTYILKMIGEENLSF